MHASDDATDRLTVAAMALTFLQRKPDSGLGNIRSSPGDPSRNIDWVLLLTQAALTVAGCFIVFSASRTRIVDDPYTFVTRQVVFAIIAAVVMVVVMSVDYEWLKERARRSSTGSRSSILSVLFIVGLVARARPHLVRPRAVQLPAGGVRQVHDAARARAPTSPTSAATRSATRGSSAG